MAIEVLKLTDIMSIVGLSYLCGFQVHIYLVHMRSSLAGGKLFKKFQPVVRHQNGSGRTREQKWGVRIIGITGVACIKHKTVSTVNDRGKE